ncbi:MAG: aminopeptidase N C-terminal domain-containing protein [Kiritimatiellae bacterium]|nr:aminopeptidase N C-terminal domain-containing protein [Kiritimatiellia bacterium]
MCWKFKRSDYRRPPVQLEHMDVRLAFFEDRVEGAGRLHCRAREAVREVMLDCDGKKVPYTLDREYAPGERFTIDVAHTCHPDDRRLEGIYRDVTPRDGRAPARPQQYMSQCQQYGFQRILPVIDDCTAKCTFRTLLEGDARYTHLISNGDRLDLNDLKDFKDFKDLKVFNDFKDLKDLKAAGRQRVAYLNRRPMAPYLFIACAGTWDVLADEVEYPDTRRRIRLEYLVPPGHADGARVPMEILKRSILFQHELTGFEYPYETYRTICMEKSLYGGMENTGNTTIITEAALIDETIPDSRLVYAHGVIPHEFEHSHCGSGVTMETVFDMWLNEAYTVNVERAFLAREFGAAFARRMEVDALRETGGAFAEEEGGAASAVVREGVNDPDEVVDAITYDKAPEVLNTLRNLIGADAYAAAWREYFRRFDGGNANTDDFLKVFCETTGRDVAALMRPWLFDAGHPTVAAKWSWADGTLAVELARDKDYVIPVPYALVKGGKDVASGTFVLDGPRQTFSTRCPKPDFISWNRGCGFYGVLVAEATEEELALQVRADPDGGNRVEAMRMLRDKGATETWLALYDEMFKESVMLACGEPVARESGPPAAGMGGDLGTYAALLSIPADSLDRRRRAFVRENVREMRALRAAAARKIGVDALASALVGSRVPRDGTKSAAMVGSRVPRDGTKSAAMVGSRVPRDRNAAAIVRRAYENCLLQLLAAANVPEAWAAIRAYLDRAANITARLNALRALVASDDPARYETLAAHGEELRRSLNGYIGFLGVVASDPHESVFASIAAEEAREGWSIDHPALSRALYCGFAANGDRLWTADGLAWLGATLVKYAQVSEYNAIRLLAPLMNWKSFPEGLRAEVGALLDRVSAALPFDRYPFIGGKLRSMRG